ncbi:hypothetical protein EON63_17720 [archaeon]|nr:MAG: hypothetical protein EON63_17720 [archaeon]
MVIIGNIGIHPIGNELGVLTKVFLAICRQWGQGEFVCNLYTRSVYITSNLWVIYITNFYIPNDNVQHGTYTNNTISFRYTHISPQPYLPLYDFLAYFS